MTPTEAIAERDQIGSNKEWRANLRSDIESVDARRSVVIHAKAVLSLLDHIDALENAVVEKDKMINREIERGNRLNKELYEALGGPTHVGILEAKAALTQAEETRNG